MIGQVQVTNTINITLILAVISAVGIIGGAGITVIFKLVSSIQKNITEIRIQQARDNAAVLAAQKISHDSLQECIHKIPGHPDSRPSNLVAETGDETLPP